MNCSACGTQLPQGAANCPRCGAATPYYYSTTEAAPDDPTVVSSPDTLAQPPPPPNVYGSPPYQSPYEPYNIAPLAPPPPSPRRPGKRIGFIVGVILLVLLLISGGVFAWIEYSAARNAAAAAAVATTTAQAHASATASAVAALQCPFGTLQSQTAIQTKVEDVPDGSALVVTLPTAGDAQNVILLANHSDLDKYVCRHDLARFGATHKGPEILVLHEIGRSSVDLILYQGSPTIKVLPNTQTASEISNFKQSYSNVYVYEETNHALSTPDQKTIP